MLFNVVIVYGQQIMHHAVYDSLVIIARK